MKKEGWWKEKQPTVKWRAGEGGGGGSPLGSHDATRKHCSLHQPSHFSFRSKSLVLNYIYMDQSIFYHREAKLVACP